MTSISTKYVTEFSKIMCIRQIGGSMSDLIGVSKNGTWSNIGEGFNNLIYKVYIPTIDTLHLPSPHIAKKVDHETTRPFTINSYKQFVDKDDIYSLPNISFKNQYETKTAIYKIARENNLSYSYEYDTLYYDCETYNSRVDGVPQVDNPHSVVATIQFTHFEYCEEQ